MFQKGVYPYDFMDSFEKLDQTELPAKEHFYNILNDQDITDDEYDHAKKVWKTFKIKTMGEYHDLYVGSDVLLLTDVFENFRKTCMQYYYKLDPCHYFTSLGLSWDAMLKMTNIELELMTDVCFICICSLCFIYICFICFSSSRRVCVVEYLTWQIDMERPTIST